MALEAMDLGLQLLKESNKKLVQCQEQCIDHIPYYLLGLSHTDFF